MFTGVVPGHLWPSAIPTCFPERLLILTSLETRPVPAGPVSKGLWECKVTPAYCACQERNTIGCISSNDGLGAGCRDWFSTNQIHGAFTKAVASTQLPAIRLPRSAKVLRRSANPGWGSCGRGRAGEIFGRDEGESRAERELLVSARSGAAANL